MLHGFFIVAMVVKMMWFKLIVSSLFSVRGAGTGPPPAVTTGPAGPQPGLVSHLRGLREHDLCTFVTHENSICLRISPEGLFLYHYLLLLQKYVFLLYYYIYFRPSVMFVWKQGMGLVL